MKSLQNCISNHIIISNSELETITANFKERTLKKGSFLLKSGIVCREMAFIESGYLRMFDIVDGREITLWIGSANSFITSLSSFVFETANHWNIEAITDCKLAVISRTDHFDLCSKSTKWLEFDNILLARSFSLLEQSMFSHLHTTAQQRFDNLMEENPELFNAVPLQYIASMIGVTPETLSRLRKKHVNS